MEEVLYALRIWYQAPCHGPVVEQGPLPVYTAPSCLMHANVSIDMLPALDPSSTLTGSPEPEGELQELSSIMKYPPQPRPLSSRGDDWVDPCTLWSKVQAAGQEEQQKDGEDKGKAGWLGQAGRRGRNKLVVCWRVVRGGGSCCCC